MEKRMLHGLSPREVPPSETLDSVKDDWIAIHSTHAAPAFFTSYDYLKIWYGNFARSEEIKIFRATEGDVTAGFLPLFLQRKKGFNMLSSLTNSHCFYSVPLIRPGFEEKFPGLILKELLRHSETWDMLRYSFAYSFTPSWNVFQEDLLKEHQVQAQTMVEPTYSVLLKDTFNEYFESNLSSKTRSTIRNRIKKLDQAGGARFIHLSGSDAAMKFPEFQRIEDSGWKGRGGSSIARVSKEYRTYYADLVKHLAQRNVMHLNFLELKNQLIAAQFGYVEGDTFHSFKIAHDESYNAFSPAVVLFIKIVENLRDRYPGIMRLHMFPWDFGYKHRFCNEEQSFRTTILFSPTLKGKAVQSWFTVRKKLRKVPVLKPLGQLCSN